MQRYLFMIGAYIIRHPSGIYYIGQTTNHGLRKNSHMYLTNKSHTSAIFRLSIP